MAASDHMTFTLEHIPNHSRSGKGVLQVNLIYPMHQLKISWPCRPGLIVCARSRELQDTALLRYRQLMIAVYHLFALSLPALESALSKKSFSRVSSPILACSSFISGSLPFLDPSKTVEAPSSTCCFQSDIWLGCTSNCSANSTSVLSPLIAANATFALKLVEWFRLVLLMLLLLSSTLFHHPLLSKIHLSTCPILRNHFSLPYNVAKRHI